MKLCAYKISDTPVNELSVYGNPDLNGNKAYVADDTVPAGYQDISSIENWAKYGSITGKDYKFVRHQIMVLAATIGWSSLSADEKLIAAQWFAVDKTSRNEVMTQEEQVAAGVSFHKGAVASRNARTDAAMLVLFNCLEWTDVLEVVDDIESSNMLYKYMEYGIEGTLEGDDPGLFDYMEARTSTPYETTGLAAKSYTTTSGSTLAEIVTKVMSILKDGDY